MKIINLAIIPLLVLALISILLGNDLTTIMIKYKKWDNIDLDLDTKTMEFNVSDLEAGLIILTTIMIVVAIMGINILASGLTGQATHILTVLIFYIGIWSILSILSWNLIFSNEIIGTILYVFFIVFFVIGVGNMLTTSGDG